MLHLSSSCRRQDQNSPPLSLQQDFDAKRRGFDEVQTHGDPVGGSARSRHSLTMSSSPRALFVALVLCFVGACHGQGGPPPDQICTEDRLAQSELTCNPTYQPPKLPFSFVYNGTRRMTPGNDDCGPPAGDPGDCWECCYKEPPAPPPPRCLDINTPPVNAYQCAYQGGWDAGVNKIMCWVFDQQGLAVQVQCSAQIAATMPDKSRVASYSCCGDPSRAYCLTQADCTGAEASPPSSSPAYMPPPKIPRIGTAAVRSRGA